MEKTNSYTNFRSGISYGKINYKIINKQLEIMGKNIYLSNKLESLCEINNILILTEFYMKLKHEFLMIN